ncbi:MAG: DUF4906 domain-containing protein [Rikenellaceae bacterium]
MGNIMKLAMLALISLTSCNIEKLEDTTIITKPEQENFDDIYAQGWVELEGQSARLAVSFEAEEQTTRSSGTTMERTINDINIYLFSETFEISQRLYLNDSSSLVLPITPGDWKVYAIANYGEDMGERSEEEVQSLSFGIVSESDIFLNDTLLMSYESEFSVDDTLSLNVLLARAVARIDVSVNLTSAALSSVTLKSIRLVNAPKRYSLFGDDSTPSSSDLMTYEYQDCSDKSTFSIYMLENLSGENTKITDESDKSEANAPSTAAYLEITAETSLAWVTYKVYLGENNTSDFNIRRNTIYDVEISIYSADESDFRTTVRPFPVDVNVSISSGSVYTIYYKEASAFLPSALLATINLTVKLDKVVDYNIAVNFDIYVDKGSGPVVFDSTYSKSRTITIAAGASTGSITLTNSQSGQSLYMYDPLYSKLTSVTRLNSADENNYYPSTSIYTSSHTYSFENY